MTRTLASPSAWLVLCVLLLGSAIGPGTALGARLSRGRAVERAARENPQVAAARAEIAQASALKQQANAARWPLVHASLGIGPTLQAHLVPGTGVQSTEEAYGDFEWSDLTAFIATELRVTQPLYTFGKIANFREAAAHGVQASEAKARMTEADVALKVVELYETLLLTREAVRLYTEVVRITERAVQQTNDRMQEGETTEIDLLRLKTARNAAQLALNYARSGQAQAETGLRAYLGLSPGEALTLAEEEFAPLARCEPSVATLTALALRQRPELQALEEGRSAFEALARARQAGYLPDVFALGFISAAYAPGRDLVNTRYAIDPFYHFVPGLIVGLRWVLQANTPSAQAAEMRAGARRLEATRQWAVVGIPAEVRVAYEKLQRARQDLAATEESLPWTRQWMVRASADYAAAFVSSMELTDSVQAYLAMRTQRLDAILRFNVGLAELAKATGTLVRGGELYPNRDRGALPSQGAKHAEAK